MAFLHLGSKKFLQGIDNAKLAAQRIEAPVIQIEERIVEVIKEVPVEVIREVKVVEERIIERPVDRIVEVIKEVPVEVIREVKVIEEKIVEVIKEIEKPFEVIKNIEVVIEKEIKLIPKWVYGIIGLESLAIIILLAIR